MNRLSLRADIETGIGHPKSDLHPPVLEMLYRILGGVIQVEDQSENLVGGQLAWSYEHPDLAISGLQDMGDTLTSITVSDLDKSSESRRHLTAIRLLQQQTGAAQSEARFYCEPMLPAKPYTALEKPKSKQFEIIVPKGRRTWLEVIDAIPIKKDDTVFADLLGVSDLKEAQEALWKASQLSPEAAVRFFLENTNASPS